MKKITRTQIPILIFAGLVAFLSMVGFIIDKYLFTEIVYQGNYTFNISTGAIMPKPNSQDKIKLDLICDIANPNCAMFFAGDSLVDDFKDKISDFNFLQPDIYGKNLPKLIALAKNKNQLLACLDVLFKSHSELLSASIMKRNETNIKTSADLNDNTDALFSLTKENLPELIQTNSGTEIQAANDFEMSALNSSETLKSYEKNQTLLSSVTVSDLPLFLINDSIVVKWRYTKKHDENLATVINSMLKNPIDYHSKIDPKLESIN